MTARSQRLAILLGISAASAGAGALLQSRVKHPDFPEGLDTPGARYALVFIAVFAVLRLAARYINIRALRTEKTRGLAPLLARGMLVALCFVAPLPFLLHAPEKASLHDIIAQERIEKDGGGYSREDRMRLEQIISKGAKGNDG